MHHRAKLPFEAVQDARWWYDNSTLGYQYLADLISDLYQDDELNQDWDQPRVQLVGISTIRDWINELRAKA